MLKRNWMVIGTAVFMAVCLVSVIPQVSGAEDSPNLTISGAVEMDYQYVDHRDRTATDSDSTSDLFVSTVEFGFEAQVNESTTATIIVLAEDVDKSGNAENNDDASDPDSPFIDEATVTIFNQEKCPFYAVAGKRGQPFGNFFTHTISDPVTKGAYEIATTGLSIGYAPADLYDLDVSLTFYKGEKLMDQVGGIGSGPGRNNSVGYAATDDVNSYILSVSAQPIENLAVGLAFDSEPGDDSRNDTVNLSAEFAIADFTVDAEFFTTSKREKFVADDKTYKDNAWVLGVAYQVNDALEVAIRYETFDNDRDTDVNGDFDNTIALGGNYEILPNVTAMAEYRILKEKTASGGTYQGTVNEFNLRLAVGF